MSTASNLADLNILSMGTSGQREADRLEVYRLNLAELVLL